MGMSVVTKEMLGETTEQEKKTPSSVPNQGSTPRIAKSQTAPVITFTPLPEPDAPGRFPFAASLPQYVSAHSGEETDPRQHIIGSIYFPDGRIRLTHFAGPAIEKIGATARYIIGGKDENEIWNFVENLYQKHQERGLDQDILQVAAELAASREFSSHVVLADEYLSPGFEKKHPLCQLCEVYKIGDEFVYHVSRGAIENINPNFSALANPQNIENIYSIVSLAQEIDEANSVLRRGKDEEIQKEKDNFNKRVEAYLTQAPEGSKVYFRQIQSNLDNIFSHQNVVEASDLERRIIYEFIQRCQVEERAAMVEDLLTYRKTGEQASWMTPEFIAAIDNEILIRSQGFFRNQVLWHSGIIDELKLNVDWLDVPLEHTDIPKKQEDSGTPGTTHTKPLDDGARAEVK